MSGFDLGTEIDRLKKRAIKAQVEYLLFCQENGISRNHMPPKMNENYTELEKIKTLEADDIKTANDVLRLINRIDDLRDSIKDSINEDAIQEDIPKYISFKEKFNLGKSKCELRDLVSYVMGEYYWYFKDHGIDPLNIQHEKLENNFSELNSMDMPIVYCKNEEDYQKIMDRIYELRSYIKTDPLITIEQLGIYGKLWMQNMEKNYPEKVGVMKNHGTYLVVAQSVDKRAKDYWEQLSDQYDRRVPRPRDSYEAVLEWSRNKKFEIDHIVMTEVVLVPVTTP